MTKKSKMELDREKRRNTQNDTAFLCIHLHEPSQTQTLFSKSNHLFHSIARVFNHFIILELKSQRNYYSQFS